MQVIPHITDEIKRNILAIADDADVAIIEIGGTVGDIESLPFLEAIRQLKTDLGRQNALYIHLTLVPFIKTSEELKTKPTQHSVMKLREIGIQPDILICRTEQMLPPEIKAKIALFCNVDKDAVITAKDVESIYEVPLFFHYEGLDEKIVQLLNIWTRAPRLEKWEAIVQAIKNPRGSVDIAIVGKYVNLKDSYKSLNEALIHGGIANRCRVNLHFVDSEKVQKEGAEKLGGRGRRDPGSRRVWRPGHRREDSGHPVRAGKSDSLLRDLSGHAAGGRRIRPQRLRPEGGQQQRIQSGNALTP